MNVRAVDEGMGGKGEAVPTREIQKLREVRH